eukprot:scaffold9620_cov197-Amphora_coffeaeformis.AAC.3
MAWLDCINQHDRFVPYIPIPNIAGIGSSKTKCRGIQHPIIGQWKECVYRTKSELGLGFARIARTRTSS